MAYISQTFSGGTDSSKYYARLYYEEVGQPDLESNTTRVRLTLKIASNNGYYTFWGFNNYGSIKVNNIERATGNYTGTVNTTEQKICSWEDDIEHTQDGSMTINIKFDVSSGYAGSASNNTNWTLTKVNRKADLTSAPDFNDDANPVINYNNPAGNSVATLQAGIFNTDGTVTYAAYRDITKTGTSYTFSLTSSERAALRNACPNSNTLAVRFSVKTVIGSTTFYSTLDKTMTIVNAKPSLGTITYSEQNAKVSALLGSSGNTVIQNMSTLRVGVPVTAQKSSTISKVVITHNGRDFTDTTSPYSFDIPITSNSFTIKATSSRPSPNDTTTQTITKTMIDYKPVAINNLVFKRQSQTSSTILLTLDATYYQRTFGSTANVPIVKWKQGNGSWNTLTSSQYTIANNKLTISNLSLGSILAYTSGDTFYLYIEDKLSSAQNSKEVPRGQATLELGKEDVVINGKTDVLTLNNDNQNTDTYLTINSKWANKKMALGIGAGGVNRGIWDYTKSKWLYYFDDNSLICNGNTIMNGRAEETDGSLVRSFSGGSGTAGWMKIGTITIGESYQNQTIIMEISQRNRHGTIYINFNSENNNDPGLYRFEKDGNIYAMIYKSATSTWDLYINKSEAYDNIQVVRYHKGKYMDNTTFTWNGNGSTVSSPPSGSINAITYGVNKYSTSEQIVGEWIDGKPIYRKVVNVGSVNAGGNKQIDNVVTNRNILVSIKGTAYSSAFNQYYGIPNAHSSISDYYINALLVGNNLQVRAGSGFTNGINTVYVIIEYTKTTD